MRRNWSHEANIKQEPISSVLTAVGAGVSILGGLKGLVAREPKAPDVEKPTVMPTEDSKLVADAKRRALIAQTQRGGRNSTILTDNETFGGK